MTDRPPTRVVDEIKGTREKLLSLVDAYKGARKEQVDADLAYEMEFSKGLIVLYHDTKNRGERLPGEDVRRALIHDGVDESFYKGHLVSKAKVDSLDKAIKIELAVLSALQSELAQIREEFRVAG